MAEPRSLQQQCGQTSIYNRTTLILQQHCGQTYIYNNQVDQTYNGTELFTTAIRTDICIYIAELCSLQPPGR